MKRKNLAEGEGDQDAEDRLHSSRSGLICFLYHTGPPLDYGPLPSFFYFALSGPDSLTQDPFNQPVQFLLGKMVRIFSMTLPGHENNLPAENAMRLWAEDISSGVDPIEPFLTSISKALDFGIKEGFIDSEKMGVGGLSRGGFIACHVAARDEKIRSLLAFAPLTRLALIKEFSSLQSNPLVSPTMSKILPKNSPHATAVFISATAICA